MRGHLDPHQTPGYLFEVFGLGFGEMVVLGIVLLVVVGPKELPKLLRSVGKGINKLKTMSQDLRDQSGIDDILEDEGLREDLNAIRSIARPGAAVAGMVNSATKPRARKPVRRPAARALALEDLELPDAPAPDRAMEFPIEGPDAYGALADDVDPAEAKAEEDAEDGDGPTSEERPTASAGAAAKEGT